MADWVAPQSPWQNAFVERFIDSIRRECLDHAIVLNEIGLRRILKSYLTYYERSRTHLALGKAPHQSTDSTCSDGSGRGSHKLVASNIVTNPSPPELALHFESFPIRPLLARDLPSAARVWEETNLKRNSRPDLQDGWRESNLGSAADTWRASDARV